MSKLMTGSWIGTRGERFVDVHGRQVILRGVNLGGDCKIPYPDGGTDRPGDFSDHREVSFVGRPFPLAEADEHLGRIAGWGFNVLRLLVTWEAVEHAGPGQYDRAYIDYVGAICERAARHGLAVFIDFHQDVWSRMSGGSGAPGWIFEALGLDFTRFGRAGAAHVMQYRYDYASPERRQAGYPQMSWSQNYRMPVNGIMWTAFFAGATFTPQWRVGGVNVQHFLQDRYCAALREVALRVRDLPNVIGFDSLNEPGLGWIGQKMTARPSGRVSGDFAIGLTGPAWTPLDGLAVARGLRTRVPRLAIENDMLVTASELEVNAGGLSIWREAAADPFEAAGAWRHVDGRAQALDEDFFCMRDGRPVDPERDFMAPFFRKVARAMRDVREDWLLFAEVNPYVVVLGRGFPQDMPERSVNANHWYDIRLLVSKALQAGLGAAERSEMLERYRFQLGFVQALGTRLGMPSLIGEFGTPYDLNEGEAFRRWAAGERSAAVFGAHAAALELMYEALDALQLSSTQWNYTASNQNDLRIGDGWNQEDLSVFSRDQQPGPDDGARALSGFCRPYVRRAQGRIGRMGFADGCFTATIEADPAIDAPTEIFWPAALGAAPVVRIDGAARCSFDATTRLLHVSATAALPLRIELRAAP
jgi:hypothetical protein